jgi:hypothetical protein
VGFRTSTRRLDRTASSPVIYRAVAVSISPFAAGLAAYQYEQDVALVGRMPRRNRWLADFCNERGTGAGVALITLDDLNATVRGPKSGDRGVFEVLLPSGAGTNRCPSVNRYGRPGDQRSADHTHTGWTRTTETFPAQDLHHGDHVVARIAFWLPAWSGVFERHESLRLVMTEQARTGWRRWMTYDMPMFRHLRRSCDCRRRSAWRGGAVSSARRRPLRYDIGVNNLMWGSDYPHIEGSWPHTEAKLKEGFGDVPRVEVERIVGANAIDTFGFDRTALAELARSIGPPADLLGTPS